MKLKEIKNNFLARINKPASLEEIILSSIFLVALLLRLLHIAAVANIPPIADAAEYNGYALGILKNFSFGDSIYPAYRGPVFSFFLSIVYFIFGYSYLKAMLAQAFLSSFSCILIYILAKKIFSKATGYIAALISASLSLFIFYSALLLSETFFIFLILVLAISLQNTLQNPSKKNLVLSGIILGICALTRPEIFFTCIFIFLVFFIYNHCQYSKTIKQASLILLFCFIVISPWTIRNYIVTKSFILVQSNGGENLWIGNNPQANGWRMHPPHEITPTNKNQIDVDRGYFQEAINFIKNNPKQWVALCEDKFLLYFRFWGDQENWTFKERFRFIGNLAPPLFSLPVVAILCCIGMILTLPFAKRLLILYAFFAGNLLLQTLMFFDPRYRMQIVPFMIIFAASPVYLIGLLIKAMPEIKPKLIKRGEEVLKKTRLLFNKIPYKRFIAICIIILATSLIAAKVITKRSYLLAKKDLIIMEGENPSDSNYFKSSGLITKNKNHLGNKSLELDAAELKNGGYYVSYKFLVTKEGDYNVILAGTPPGPKEKGNEWFSPYTVSIDNTVVKDLNEEKTSKDWPQIFKYPYLSGGYYFAKMLSVHLNKGQHDITFRITERRKHDGHFTFYIDAIIISPQGFKAAKNIGIIPKRLFEDL